MFYRDSRGKDSRIHRDIPAENESERRSSFLFLKGNETDGLLLLPLCVSITVLSLIPSLSRCPPDDDLSLSPGNLLRPSSSSVHLFFFTRQRRKVKKSVNPLLRSKVTSPFLLIPYNLLVREGIEKGNCVVWLDTRFVTHQNKEKREQRTEKKEQKETDEMTKGCVLSVSTASSSQPTETVFTTASSFLPVLLFKGNHDEHRYAKRGKEALKEKTWEIVCHPRNCLGRERKQYRLSLNPFFTCIVVTHPKYIVSFLSLLDNQQKDYIDIETSSSFSILLYSSSLYIWWQRREEASKDLLLLIKVLECMLKGNERQDIKDKSTINLSSTKDMKQRGCFAPVNAS